MLSYSFIVSILRWESARTSLSESESAVKPYEKFRFLMLAKKGPYKLNLILKFFSSKDDFF
jgi:hypothetical protein